MALAVHNPSTGLPATLPAGAAEAIGRIVFLLASRATDDEMKTPLTVELVAAAKLGIKQAAKKPASKPAVKLAQTIHHTAFAAVSSDVASRAQRIRDEDIIRARQLDQGDMTDEEYALFQQVRETGWV